MANINSLFLCCISLYLFFEGHWICGLILLFIGSGRGNPAVQGREDVNDEEARLKKSRTAAPAAPVDRYDD